MRKNWFAAWAVAGLAAGCAGPNNLGMPGGMASSAQPGATGGMPAVEQATWTERITAPLSKTLSAVGIGRSKSPSTPLDRLTPYEPSQESPELYVGMAQVAHRGGNVEHARQFYQKALQMDPNHLEALLGAARMEDREGRLDVAIMLYRRAAAAHPRNATALNDLALCHARSGELPLAHQALESAILLESQKALYRNNVAKVLVELNQLDRATHHLTAVHPPAVAHYNMGVLLAERGRDGESADYLARALAIDPQLEPARVLLTQKTMPASGSAGESRQMMAGAPTIQQVPIESNDFVLPTPEAVATVPWKPPVSVDAVVQPGSAANSPLASPRSTGNSSVLLLPPVK